MASRLVDDMTAPWASSNTAVLQVSAEEVPFFGRTVTTTRLRRAGTGSATAEQVLGAPLDLSGFDELRVWVKAGRPADGSAARPFYLALSYHDAGDAGGEEHRWFIPVNRSGAWEQRRIGIEHDRRGAVERLRLETAGQAGFTANLSQLIAVREDMLADLEQALVDAVSGIQLPGQPPGQPPVPVVVQVEAPPVPTPTPTPAVQIVVTNLDVREDPARGGSATQRDSFRPRGTLTACSVRPAARAYIADYQLTAVATNRADQVRIHGALLGRLTADRALWANGAQVPVWILAPPGLLERATGVLAPLYVRLGSRAEVAPRSEQPLVRQAELRTGRVDGPGDPEGIVIEL